MFYTRAIDFLEALNINTKQADPTKAGWKQLKMMFEGEDRQTLQTLNDNGTITEEQQKIPWQVLDATATTFRSKKHFWQFSNELLSDACQWPNEGIHSLNTHIMALVNKCKFPMMKPRRHWRSWSSSMWWGTRKPRNGSDSKASPSWSTEPFSPIASCLNPDASSIKRPRRRAGLTSPPSQLPPPQCLPANKMPSQPSPNVPLWLLTSPGKYLAYSKECYNCGGKNHWTALYKRSKRPNHPSHDARARLPQPTDRSLQRERAGPDPDATIPAACAETAPHPAGTPTSSQAKAPPIALPQHIPAGHPKETEGPPL